MILQLWAVDTGTSKAIWIWTDIDLNESDIGLNNSEIESKRVWYRLKKCEIDLNEPEIDLIVSEIDLNESEIGLNESEIGLNECEDFFKANLRSIQVRSIFSVNSPYYNQFSKAGITSQFG